MLKLLALLLLFTTMAKAQPPPCPAGTTAFTVQEVAVSALNLQASGSGLRCSGAMCTRKVARTTQLESYQACLTPDEVTAATRP